MKKMKKMQKIHKTTKAHKIQKITTLALGVATLAVNFLGLTSTFAWGPERDTFTMNSPATYPVFNSITDNPTIGDERDFVRIAEIDQELTEAKNEVEVVPGRQYLVYIYFHNNASSTYNDSAHHNAGVALRTRLSSAFDTVLTPAAKGKVSATITADNSDPESVWDEAYMTTKSEKVLLHYVAGSSRIYNDWGANDSVLPSSLFTEEGTLLGLNALNGVIPGCEEYHGIVTYVLQAEELGGSIDKSVSVDGENYTTVVNAHSGDEIYYQLTIRNTGDVALTNVTIKDTFPEGLELVPGSVGLRANDSTTVDPLSDDILTTGYNFGTLGTGNVVYLTYRAKVTGDYDCAGKELMNSALLVYDSDVATGDSREDTAIVFAKTAEECEIPEEMPDDLPEPPSQLPNTGPLEITLAIVIVLGIGGGSFYYYRAHKTLKTLENDASGKADPDDSSQNPDNMVK